MNDEQREMLKTLLADRFQLKFHRETKQGSVDRLSQSGKKLMLEPAKDRDVSLGLEESRVDRKAGRSPGQVSPASTRRWSCWQFG
jgi:uncharacterized protein (TIGR03435 family)